MGKPWSHKKITWINKIPVVVLSWFYDWNNALLLYLTARASVLFHAGALPGWIPNAEVPAFASSCCCSLYCAMCYQSLPALDKGLRITQQIHWRPTPVSLCLVTSCSWLHLHASVSWLCVYLLLFSQWVLEDDGRLSPEGWNRQAHRCTQEIQYVQVWVRSQGWACAVLAGVRRHIATIFRHNLVKSLYPTGSILTFSRNKMHKHRVDVAPKAYQFPWRASAYDNVTFGFYLCREWQ